MTSLTFTRSAPYRDSWDTLLALDRESDELPQLANQLLAELRSRGSEDLQFSEEEALQLIELIDVVVLQHNKIPAHLKSTAFTLLRKISGKFRILPRSCLIGEDFRIRQEVPFGTSRYADLWKRRLGGSYVVVKALRFAPKDMGTELQGLFKEVLLWKRLDHPNILSFCGVSMSQGQPCVVSPWMENGNILKYTRMNPEVNRLHLLSDVAGGLEYLHRADLVHGNIRGSNVLISYDKPPRALLGDVGLDSTMSGILSLTRASIDWAAPELLAPDDTLHQPSFASDIYALAMVVYEVLTGGPPFARRGKAELICKVVLGDGWPPRPRDSGKLGFTDEVWESLLICWRREPSARSSINAVSTCLKQAAESWVADVPAFMFASEAGVEHVMNLKESQAQDFADMLDKTLSHIDISRYPGMTYFKYLQQLCGASGVLPASFILTGGFDDIEAQPFTRGQSADVYKATYEGRPVVVKAPKLRFFNHRKKVHVRFVKEVIRWKCLLHESILSLVGVALTPPPFSTVSPWMENGNIMSFTRTTPDQNPFSLLVDVTNGLQYLHQRGFVHGNLKGTNILINSKFHACLADFCLAVITEDTTSVEGPSSHEVGDSIRWMAPEILDPVRYGFTNQSRRKLPSKSTDIYALGVTILEVVSGRQPFGILPDAAVIQKVLSGDLPAQPAVGFSDPLWALLVQTWLEEYESSLPVRPYIITILERLRDEAKTWSPMCKVPDLAIPMERKASPKAPIAPFLPDVGEHIAESDNPQRAQTLADCDTDGVFPASSGSEVDRVLLENEIRSGQLLDLDRDQVQKYVDILDTSLGERTLPNHIQTQQLKRLRRICGTVGIFPSSFVLSDALDEHGSMPVASGGFSHVYRTTFQGRHVAVKYFAITTEKGSLPELYKLLAREVVGWKWLQHEHILPFIGVTPKFAIVSDLMENGTIMNFITNDPRHNRLRLLIGVATGLEYLHSRNIIHGDLKGANVLIDSNCSARLADFGLAMIVDESTVGSTTGGHGLRGTTRWMAPEILFPEHFEFSKDCQRRLPSTSTDIYALGMTVLEVLTGKRPFNDIRTEPTVILEVAIKGTKPNRPSFGFSDGLWSILLTAWDAEYGSQPSKRPSIQTILNQLKEDVSNWDRYDIPLVPKRGEESPLLGNSEWGGSDGINATVTPEVALQQVAPQQVPSPRGVAAKLKRFSASVGKIRKTITSFRAGNLK